MGDDSTVNMDAVNKAIVEDTERKLAEAEAKRAEKLRRVLARRASMRQAQKDAPPRNHRVPMRCDFCRTNGVETCDFCIRCIACCRGCERYAQTLYNLD